MTDRDRQLSDAIKLAKKGLKKDDLSIIRRRIRSLEVGATGAGIQFVKRVQIATASGVGETGWSSYREIDLSIHAPRSAKAVLLSILHESTHSGGSAGDSDNRINWLVNAFPTVPFEDRYFDVQSLVDNAGFNVTHQVLWPVNPDLSAQWRYYNYVSGTGTQTYTIYLDGYFT